MSAVYKDTPNNRKLGRVGEKFGDPKFKTSKKVAAPKKAAPPVESSKPNILTKQSIELLKFYWKYAGSDTKPPFKYVKNRYDWNKTSSDLKGEDEPLSEYLNNTGILTTFYEGDDEDGDPIYEPPMEEWLDDYVKLENALEQGLQLKDLGSNDQKMIRAIEKLKPKSKAVPKKVPVPKKVVAPLKVVKLKQSKDFSSVFGTKFKPKIKIDKSKITTKKPVPKKVMNMPLSAAPKSLLEIQKDKDKDKLKSFKQYQNYVQLF